VELRDGIAYIDGGDEHVYALNAQSGTQIWRSSYGGQSLRDLNASDRHLTISAQNELVVFDRRTGRRVATLADPTGRGVVSLFGIPLADDTGRIFVSGAQGLVCFRVR
jgi:outer membrane protein assembly factor BamB